VFAAPTERLAVDRRHDANRLRNRARPRRHRACAPTADLDAGKVRTGSSARERRCRAVGGPSDKSRKRRRRRSADLNEGKRKPSPGGERLLADEYLVHGPCASSSAAASPRSPKTPTAIPRTASASRSSTKERREHHRQRARALRLLSHAERLACSSPASPFMIRRQNCSWRLRADVGYRHFIFNKPEARR